MTPSDSSVRAIAARHAEEAADNRVFFHPDIPEHRLASALAAYPGLAPDDVLVLLDNSANGGATEGLVLAGAAVHVRADDGMVRTLALRDLRSAEYAPGPPGVLALNGREVLAGVRVRPRTMEQVAAMLRETAAAPTGGGETPETGTATNRTVGPETDGAAPRQGGSVPALWTPAAWACLSFFLSPAFGAILAGLNWRALGKPRNALRSFLWTLPEAALFVAAFRLSGGLTALLVLGYFLAWYFAEARPHIAYVQEHVAPDYPRRRWAPPVACALVALALALFAVGMVAAARPESTVDTAWEREMLFGKGMLERNAVGIVTEILASSGHCSYSQAPRCVRVRITEEIAKGFHRAVATLDTGRQLPITIEYRNGTIHVRTEL